LPSKSPAGGGGTIRLAPGSAAAERSQASLATSEIPVPSSNSPSIDGEFDFER
jgi:hypothetical protein